MRVGAGLGGAFVDRRLGVGAMVHWDYLSTKFGGNKGFVNLGTSVSGHLGDQVVLTLSGDNFIPNDIYFAPLTLSPAVRWEVADVAGIEADLITDFTSLDRVALSFQVGAEFRVAQLVPIRTGFFRDTVNEQDLFTAGIGVGGDKGGLDYGFQMPVGQQEDFKSWHGFSVMLMF